MKNILEKFLSREIGKGMLERGYGKIVFIASLLSFQGGITVPGYAASKGGLIQFTRWLSTVLAPGIRVNSISPGGIWRDQPDSFHQRYVERTPLGRMANEDDFKGIIAYLASDASAYVTGQNIMVDGGWSAW